MTVTTWTPLPSSAFRYAGSVATSVLPSPVRISAILPWCRTMPPIDLHVVVAHADRAAAGLAHGRERLGQDLVGGVLPGLLALLFRRLVGDVLEALAQIRLEALGADRELRIGQRLDLLFQGVDLVEDGLVALERALAGRAENGFEELF